MESKFLSWVLLSGLYGTPQTETLHPETKGLNWSWRISSYLGFKFFNSLPENYSLFWILLLDTLNDVAAVVRWQIFNDFNESSVSVVAELGKLLWFIWTKFRWWLFIILLHIIDVKNALRWPTLNLPGGKMKTRVQQSRRVPRIQFLYQAIPKKMLTSVCITIRRE